MGCCQEDFIRRNTSTKQNEAVGEQQEEAVDKATEKEALSQAFDI